MTLHISRSCNLKTVWIYWIVTTVTRLLHSDWWLWLETLDLRFSNFLRIARSRNRSVDPADPLRRTNPICIGCLPPESLCLETESGRFATWFRSFRFPMSGDNSFSNWSINKEKLSHHMYGFFYIKFWWI